MTDQPGSTWRTWMGPLASLKLTVVLIVLAIILVFAGSLAQTKAGIYQVLHQYFRTFIAWIDLDVFNILLPFQLDFSLSIPFPGGWAIGGAMLANLIAAHLVRFRLSAKRSGILLIHVGLIILLIGELVTGLAAVEGTMLIPEEGSSNYVEHINYSELAIIDRSSDTTDDVVVIPGSFVQRAARSQSPITHDLLSVDVRVLKHMPNAAIVNQIMPGMPTVNVGHGTRWGVIEQPTVSGVDPNQRVNQPAAFVELLHKDTGESIGTYLLSAAFSQVGPQAFTLNGKTFHLALRYARTYKPYTLQLMDFKHDRYMGTDIPSNFSSRVRLIDPTRNADREVLIYMNHPLRHAGETFYQASFTSDEKATVLQVVRNPGWLLPYVSSAIISLGLAVQFVIGLAHAARKERAA